MGKTQEIMVKIVAREYVKPAIPTPCNRKIFKMCYLDQRLPLNPPFLTSTLLFYTRKLSDIDVTSLKTSLSKTLTSFYPLAGRVKQSTIECNDQGMPFIEAHVNCSLSQVLNSSRKLELVTKFLPPRESLGFSESNSNNEKELIHFAIQVNIFTCGGFAIGWYDIHKIMDGTSSANFIKHWAALSRQRQQQANDNAASNDGKDLVEPDFDAPNKAFPPSPKPKLLQLMNGSWLNSRPATGVVVKSFLFKKEAITKLKAMGSSHTVAHPTRYLALAGFIWQQLQSVSMVQPQQYQHTDIDTDTILQVTIDIRPFTNPPLPKASIGNLIDTALARAESSATFPELVARIHGAIAKMKDEIRECYHGEKAVQVARASWDKLITTVSKYELRSYKIVSWCNLGFNDIDFGFGKPDWIVPTDGIMSPFHKNLIILTKFNEHDIQAWFFVEEKDMKLLESNSQLLAFASPLY